MTPGGTPRIESVTLQSMSQRLGPELAVRYCAPLAFYMVLRAVGYLPPELLPDEFCAGLDRDSLTTGAKDWSRPALSRIIRRMYGAEMVSWALSGGADHAGNNLERMRTAGYLDTEREVAFFQQRIYGHSVEEIVRSGLPVIATMDAGFDHGGSNIHAVVIARWDDEGVTVVDPDGRNPKEHYTAEQINRHLSANGAGTVILPPTA